MSKNRSKIGEKVSSGCRTVLGMLDVSMIVQYFY